MFSSKRLIGRNARISSAKKIEIARVTRQTARLILSVNPSCTYPFMSFFVPQSTNTHKPPMISTYTRTTTSQCTIRATVSCGIISPICDAHFATSGTLFHTHMRKFCQSAKKRLKIAYKRFRAYRLKQRYQNSIGKRTKERSMQCCFFALISRFKAVFFALVHFLCLLLYKLILTLSGGFCFFFQSVGFGLGSCKQQLFLSVLLFKARYHSFGFLLCSLLAPLQVAVLLP
uniref:Uncharacterized protein n=1 Tax=uncultured prokaryote TaxID=198431 RepID=A0A0H5Q7Z6_9ZZZZ|nr:hypothetical protein [uncultured prokaryote]